MNIAQIHQKFLLSSGADTDTRKIRKNSIFFALKGERFNGNTFAAEAISKGASFAVVDEKAYALNKDQYILVKDVLQTLQKVALFHRKFLGLPILAITGSNGKTTTKELVRSILSRKFKTIATRGNLNNHIGVPLTLLSMDQDTEFGIVEMGANHTLEIEFLCSIAKPDYGYITNFGKAHLEGFGDLEGVIKAKTELYKHLEENKKLLFLNFDDEIQKKQIKYNHTFSFGSGRLANVQIEYIQNTNHAEIKYNNTTFTTNLIGAYNAVNIAAALCIGLYFKVDFSLIKDAIENYDSKNNRSQLLELRTNTVLLDAYNANPTSMHAALDNFDKLKTNKQKILILGDMFELGAATTTEHQVIINLIENKKFAQAYLLGENFRQTSVISPTIIKFKSFENLKKHLNESNLENCYILIKGSRGMAMERLLNEL